MKSFLYLILGLALIVRVISIDSYPSGFTPDEASFGYDAYSILKTGRDQWGRFMPLYLESFGDFKLPLYTYLTIPSVATLGLNVFAVRLPSALLGTAAVYVTFLLSKELRERFLNRLKPKIWSLEFVVSFLLAISPWHVMLSRGAFEANLTTLFLPLGVLFFLKGFRRHHFLPISSLFFGLNMFSYHTARLVTPVLVVFLIILFRKELVKIGKSKNLIYSGFVFLFFVFLTLFTFSQGSARRAQERSIARGALEAQAQGRLKAINSGINPLIARVFHNKYLVISSRFITNYEQYLSFKFLFRDGAREATYGMIPGIGVLYWFEAPFLLFFLYGAFKRERRNLSLFILFWILLSPIPAALATGVGYSANRVAIMMPAIQVATGLGFVSFCDLVGKLLRPRGLVFSGIFLILLVIFSFSYFLKDYLTLYPFKYSNQMLYGNMNVAYWLSEYTKDFSRITVSSSLSEPHIYIAFVNKWDPTDYQSNSRSWKVYKLLGVSFLDQIPEYNLGKYIFKKIDEKELNVENNSLLVGRPNEFPEGSKIVRTFYYPNGEPSILVVKSFGDRYAEKIY
jgi:4-amino-4-deoxy-L-arabinose transferase-like glycosyltransferase